MGKKTADNTRESRKVVRSSHFIWFPFFVLIVSIFITFLAWNYSRKKIEQETHFYFDQQASINKEEIVNAIESYSDTLYGVQGLFMVTGDVSRSKWTDYIASINLKNRFPGIHNLSFSRYVPFRQKDLFERKIRKELGQEAIAIHPPGDRLDYFPIELSAFFMAEKRDFALDIGGDPIRREALERAIQSGKPEATGKTLISSAKKNGFCIRLPIYRLGLSHYNTEKDRREGLVGIASIVFSMDEFMESVLGNKSKKEMGIEIFDLGRIESPRPASLIKSDPNQFLLYSDDGKPHFNDPTYHPIYSLTDTIDIAGERWLFYFVTHPGFSMGAENYFPIFILMTGLVISGLFFGITWTLVTSQYRAIDMANAMTADLRESEEKFRSFTETASDAIITADRKGKIIYVNEGAHQITGYTAQELIGKDYSLLIPERDRDTRPGDFLKKVSTKRLSGSGKSKELIALRKDGREIPVELSMTRWKNEKGVFFSAIIRDISERKKTEQSLNQKNAFVQLLYVVTVAANESSTLEEALQTCLNEICGHMIWSVGHVYFKSSDMDKILYPSSIWYFDNPSDFVSFKMESERTYLRMGEGLPGMVLKRAEPLSGPISTQNRNHPRVKVAESAGLQSSFAIPLLVKDEVVAVLEFFSKNTMEPDVSTLEVMAHIGTQLGRVIERKKAQEELDYMATHDPLSHLPNRTLFSDRLEHAIANAKRNNSMAAVLFVDLDQFKRINDTLGHTLGDFALREVAKRLHKCVRAGDTVARWGGDEFTLLFENIGKVDILPRICHKVLDAISQPILVEGKELHLSTSIGITISPLDGDNAELLLKNADIAMYRAKEKGRNTYQFYSQEMSIDSSEKLELENQLRHAIERKEFILYYQPFIDLKSEKIVGAEALIRWNHPTLGMVAPGKFIPLAEETGLILAIGDWVLKTACAQNKAWQDMGLPPIRVAINLSARQFQRPGIVEMVKNQLGESGLSPQHLELELTETILMQKTDEMISTLGQLHEMGIQISLDDFGTGYSSLSYIKKFPIDTLKIDQSFVRDITT
ncbi:MAG: EAL domain-containing protein, partial [Nitrospiria bacterium]